MYASLTARGYSIARGDGSKIFVKLGTQHVQPWGCWGNSFTISAVPPCAIWCERVSLSVWRNKSLAIRPGRCLTATTLSVIAIYARLPDGIPGTCLTRQLQKQ